MVVGWWVEQHNDSDVACWLLLASMLLVDDGELATEGCVECVTAVKEGAGSAFNSTKQQ